MKGSAIAHPNIAIIKHWGFSNIEKLLPASPSYSFVLGDFTAHTTIEFGSQYKHDSLVIVQQNGAKKAYTKDHDERTRMIFSMVRTMAQQAGVTNSFKAVSHLNFPMSAGIASSAAGVAALCSATERALPQTDISNLVSQAITAGSSSALRSFHDGWVSLTTKNVATSTHDSGHWNLVDHVVVAEPKQKKWGSLEGHAFAANSVFQVPRIAMAEAQMEALKRAISDKDFTTFSRISELQAQALHAVMMSSNPPMVYPNTVTGNAIAAVYKMQQSGIDVTWTLDAGAAVHVISHAKDSHNVQQYLGAMDPNPIIRISTIGSGAQSTDQHLF